MDNTSNISTSSSTEASKKEVKDIPKSTIFIAKVLAVITFVPIALLIMVNPCPYDGVGGCSAGWSYGNSLFLPKNDFEFIILILFALAISIYLVFKNNDERRTKL